MYDLLNFLFTETVFFNSLVWFFTSSISLVVFQSNLEHEVDKFDYNGYLL